MVNTMKETSKATKGMDAALITSEMEISMRENS
jgi:hypothetical protein